MNMLTSDEIDLLRDMQIAYEATQEDVPEEEVSVEDVTDIYPTEM